MRKYSFRVPDTELRNSRRQGRLRQRKRRIKKGFCVRLSVLRSLHFGHVVQNMQVYFRLLGTNGFQAKNERFTVEGRCCPQNLTYENFTSSFGRLRQKKLHQKECRTCSTIIFPYSTNQIINLWLCRCPGHFLDSILGTLRNDDGNEDLNICILNEEKNNDFRTCVFHFETFV